HPTHAESRGRDPRSAEERARAEADGDPGRVEDADWWTFGRQSRASDQAVDRILVQGKEFGLVQGPGRVDVGEVERAAVPAGVQTTARGEELLERRGLGDRLTDPHLHRRARATVRPPAPALVGQSVAVAGELHPRPHVVDPRADLATDDRQQATG